MNSGTGTKSAKKIVPVATNWSQVSSKLPLSLFHTLRGPLIGHLQKIDVQRIRVYAPAMLEQPMAGKIVYMPILFVEEYIELFWSTMFGVSRPPMVIIEGYKAYFEEFRKGAYQLKPVLVNAGVDANEVTVEAARDGELRPCPACQQLLSHWAAHYPVLTAEDKWVCEITYPNVREDYPGYDVQAIVSEKGGFNGAPARS